MEFGVRGVVLLQVWLMISGIIGFAFMMGIVSGGVGAKTFTDSKGMTWTEGAHGWTDEHGGFSTIPPGYDKGSGSSNLQTTTNTDGLLGSTKGGGFDSLASGVQWAVMAYFLGTMLGDMLGMTEDNSQALGTALAAGAGVYKALSTYAGSNKGGIFGSDSTLGGNPGWVGLVVAAAVFIYMYKKVDTKVVTFSCLPWQAPVGGNVCEDCNDEDLPCSEYRCKSLGQNCEIVNSGTEDEKCVNINPRDVNPPVIRPNYDVLTKGHEYSNVRNSPPGPGFNIIRSDASDGCLLAFTPLEFGLSINEPAQCKIDFNHTEKFEDMVSYMGGSNLYLYNHSESFRLPSSAALKNGSLIIENGEDMTFFVRCRDKNGNENGAEYAVNFCVDPTPDSTAPVIEATSVMNGGCVAENVDTAEVRFYTNEPAQCRWSTVDQSYENMMNDMVCDSSTYQSNTALLFTCISELGGIPRDGAEFYVRCADMAEDVNIMKQSYVFSLRGSTALVLKDLRPNETISGAIDPMPVELYAETLFGCNNGQAVCFWSDDGVDYIEFFDTNTADGINTQRLDLPGGRHVYYVRCIDAGGNLVESNVSFDLDIDTNPPIVARIYEEDNMLKIVTTRESDCAYSFDNCDFVFDEGTEMPYGKSTVHVAEWNEDKTYYIKCRDEFVSEGAGCNAVIRPTQNFL